MDQSPKTYGVYTYTWKGKQFPFYVGKDSNINEGARDKQHRNIKNPKTIIDKALSGAGKYGLVYEVVAKFGNEKEMTLHEALLIDYYHKLGECKANLVNELFSPYNKRKFWGSIAKPRVMKQPLPREAAWIKKGGQ